MQIVSFGDSLHEMATPIFWEKKKEEKYHQIICWMCPESAYW